MKLVATESTYHKIPLRPFYTVYYAMFFFAIVSEHFRTATVCFCMEKWVAFEAYIPRHVPASLLRVITLPLLLSPNADKTSTKKSSLSLNLFPPYADEIFPRVIPFFFIVSRSYVAVPVGMPTSTPQVKLQSESKWGPNKHHNRTLSSLQTPSYSPSPRASSCPFSSISPQPRWSAKLHSSKVLHVVDICYPESYLRTPLPCIKVEALQEYYDEVDLGLGEVVESIEGGDECAWAWVEQANLKRKVEEYDDSIRTAHKKVKYAT
jgi:hypothetical protein